MIILCFHDRLRICEKHAQAFPLPLPPAAGSWPVEHWEVSHATCSGWRRCQHATVRSKQASGLPLSFAFCLFLSAAWIAPTTTISKIWLFKKGKIWARVQQPIAAEAAHLFWGRRRVITQKICCVKKEVRCVNNGREVYLDVSVNLALGWFILEPPNQANMNLNKIEPQPGYKFVSIMFCMGWDTSNKNIVVLLVADHLVFRVSVLKHMFQHKAIIYMRPFFCFIDGIAMCVCVSVCVCVCSMCWAR